jgi:predicted Fe-S protein YdhL (DUF1289 family)
MISAPPSAPPASPCVRNCWLDERNVGVGCGRALEEFVAWCGAEPGENAAVLARSRARAALRSKSLDR